MTSIIKKLHAREVFTTKGTPTIEVDVLLEDGSLGRASAPGGTSRGEAEACDLTDGDPSYFRGLGVSKAILNVCTEIADHLIGKDAADQEKIDWLLIELDGTENKCRLGGNAIIATSLATAKAAAQSRAVELYEHLGGGQEIPIPFIYMMFGGPSFVGLPGVCDFQEYSLIPLSAKCYKEGFIATLSIYKKLSRLMMQRLGNGIPNYEKLAGIPVARFNSNDEAYASLTRLIKEEGYEPWIDFGIYTDIAASQLYRNGMYHLEADQQVLSRDQMIDKLEEMCTQYPILCMEDCLHEDDWEGWMLLTKRLGNRVELIGDDLFVTNAVKLRKGIQSGAANAIVIKPNQVGTLTETIETIKTAKAAGYGTIISPRSGELWDPYLVHLCVGQNLGQGKIVGAYPTGESSLNELIRVEDHLGNRAVYRGKNILSKYLR